MCVIKGRRLFRAIAVPDRVCRRRLLHDSGGGDFPRFQTGFSRPLLRVLSQRES